jgi:hypothetical protein
MMVGFAGNQFGDFINATITYFREYQSTPNSTAARIDWPVAYGLKFYLITMPSGFSTKTMIVIENTIIFSKPSKEELGF